MSKRAPMVMARSAPPDVAAFFTAREAGDYALSRGWRRSDAILVRWRFSQFWCVGQHQSVAPDTYRLLTYDEWVDVTP